MFLVGRLVISLLAFISFFSRMPPLYKGFLWGTIREYKKEDGSASYHAEIHLKGYPPYKSPGDAAQMEKTGLKRLKPN